MRNKLFANVWMRTQKKILHRLHQAALLVMVLSHCSNVFAIESVVFPAGTKPIIPIKKVFVHGVTSTIQMLEIPSSIDTVVEYMKAEYPSFMSIAAPKHQVSFVGVVSDQYWIITLEAMGVHQTFASVSSRDKGVKISGTRSPVWLPSGARLVFQVEQNTSSNDGVLTQHVWAVNDSVEQVQNDVYHALLQDAWRNDAWHAMSGFWHKQQETIYLSIVDYQGRTGIFLQQYAEKKP
jgi:hypothetical protein